MTREPDPTDPRDVRLRAVRETDISDLFVFERDAEANRLAAVHPRDERTFLARWRETLGDPTVVARAIVADGALVGRIECFPVGDEPHVGYWIAREQWNRRIATRALALFLEVVTTRPLNACVAEHNLASVRVLQRAGFRVTGTRHCPPSDRLVECREVLLTLVQELAAM